MRRSTQRLETHSVLVDERSLPLPELCPTNSRGWPVDIATTSVLHEP